MMLYHPRGKSFFLIATELQRMYRCTTCEVMPCLTRSAALGSEASIASSVSLSGRSSLGGSVTFSNRASLGGCVSLSIYKFETLKI